MTTYRFWLFVAACLLVSLVGLHPASAQEELTPEEQAAKLYKEGSEAYLGADYAIAITKFQEGFELDPNAMFLYNLSLCFSKLGNFQEALEHAQKAEEMGDMPDEATTKNRGRLASLPIVVQAESIAQALAAPKDAAPPTCAVDTDCEDGYICNIRRGICVASLVPETPPYDPLFSPLGWAGVGLAGAGVAMITAMLIINAGLPADIEEAERLYAEGRDEEALALEGKIDSRQTLGIILLIGGAAATAGGAGLIVYDLFLSGEEEAPAALIPYVSSDGAGLTWRLRF